MAKAVKKSKGASKLKPTSGITVPSLLGLALLLGLLCVLPWVSNQSGSDSWRALQVCLALLLALTGGFCLGLQVAANRKK